LKKVTEKINSTYMQLGVIRDGCYEYRNARS